MLGTVLLSISGFTALNAALWYGGSALLFGPHYEALSRSKKWKWNDRVISIVHAIIAAAVSLYSTCRYFNTYTTPSFQGIVNTFTLTPRDNDPLAAPILMFSTGYFIYDIGQLYLAGCSETLSYVHHAISAIAFLVATSFGWCLWIPVFLDSTELSSPLLHASWFLLHSRYKDTQIHISCQLAFMFVFIIHRIVLASIILAACYWALFFNFHIVFVSFTYASTLVFGFTLFMFVQFIFLRDILKKFVVTCFPGFLPSSSAPSGTQSERDDDDEPQDPTSVAKDSMVQI